VSRLQTKKITTPQCLLKRCIYIYKY